MPSRAFLTGGTGVVGSDLLRGLVDDDWDVTALVRSEAGAATINEAHAKPVHGDITIPDGLVDAMWGTDVVFHVAGINEGCPKDPNRMLAANVDGTVNIIKAAGDAGVGRVVYTSSVSAIGEASGMVGTERTKHSGDYVSAYARSKHLAEQAAVSTANDVGVDLVIVCPSSVQGPGRSTGSAELLLRALRSPRPRLFDATFSVIDIADCTRGHMLAATAGRPGERYILSGHSTTVSAIVDVVNSTTSYRIDPRWISESVFRSLGFPLSRLAGLVGKGDRICPDLIRSVLHGHRFDNAKSVGDLGLVYSPLAETIRRTIGWFESQGLIEP